MKPNKYAHLSLDELLEEIAKISDKCSSIDAFEDEKDNFRLLSDVANVLSLGE